MTESINMLPPPRYLARRNAAQIVKAYENGLPESRGKANDRKDNARAGQRKQKEPAFAAKVRRRWTDAKSRVRRRLGLYTLVEPIAIGLYVDVFV